MIDKYSKEYKMINESVEYAKSEDELIFKAKLIEITEIFIFPFIVGSLMFIFLTILPYTIFNNFIDKCDTLSKTYYYLHKLPITWAACMFVFIWEAVNDRIYNSIRNMSRFAWDILNVLSSNTFIKDRIKRSKKAFLSRYRQYIQKIYNKYAMDRDSAKKISLIFSGLYTLICVIVFIVGVL